MAALADGMGYLHVVKTVLPDGREAVVIYRTEVRDDDSDDFQVKHVIVMHEKGVPELVRLNDKHMEALIDHLADEHVSDELVDPKEDT